MCVSEVIHRTSIDIQGVEVGGAVELQRACASLMQVAAFATVGLLYASVEDKRSCSTDSTAVFLDDYWVRCCHCGQGLQCSVVLQGDTVACIAK